MAAQQIFNRVVVPHMSKHISQITPLTRKQAGTCLVVGGGVLYNQRRGIFGGPGSGNDGGPMLSDYMPTRRRKLPMNTVIKFVPQQEAWIVERFGKFHRRLEPGLAILIPVIDEISYVHSLKEIAIEVPSQSAITQDNVTLHLDGVLYLRVEDPVSASYGVEDPEYAVKQLAQTTMRSEIGKMSLDNVFRERDSLNASIVDVINGAANVWGIKCLRYEIRDIQLPERVVEAMQMQVSAERKKRAKVLESEGQRESEINIAEGKKRAAILASEATMMEEINRAEGQAKAILARAAATSRSLDQIGAAMQRDGGAEAAQLNIATHYVDAFGKLAKETNTILLPSNAGDPASMVAQAMAIYKQQSTSPTKPSGPTGGGGGGGGGGDRPTLDQVLNETTRSQHSSSTSSSTTTGSGTGNGPSASGNNGFDAPRDRPASAAAASAAAGGLGASMIPPHTLSEPGREAEELTEQGSELLRMVEDEVRQRQTQL
eukprot:Clim_evm4s175 gene=Clim_evmTU4s175